MTYLCSNLEIFLYAVTFFLLIFPKEFALLLTFNLQGNIPVSWEEQNSGVMMHSEFPWQIIVLAINACEYEVPDGTEVSCYSEVDVRNMMAERAVWRMVEHYHSLEENQKITCFQTCTCRTFLLQITNKHCY
jgi:hypothetical protein